MSVIRVQGETYKDREELLLAIRDLEHTLENMPESGAARDDLAAHIERLKTAAGENGSTPRSETEPSAEPERDGDDAPVPFSLPEDDEEEDEDELRLPPDMKLCPICKGVGGLPIEPPLDPRTEVCARCQGYGQVITGSNVEGQTLRDCPDCQGQGWIETRSTYVPPELPATDNLAAPSPGWPGAVWDADEQVWNPPPDQSAPWTGAVWDELKGAWQ